MERTRSRGLWDMTGHEEFNNQGWIQDLPLTRVPFTELWDVLEPLVSPDWSCPGEAGPPLKPVSIGLNQLEPPVLSPGSEGDHWTEQNHQDHISRTKDTPWVYSSP